MKHLAQLAFGLAVASGMMEAGQAQEPGTAREALQRLLADDWRFRIEDSPEWATQLGEHRFDDRLTDLSPAAIERRKRHPQEVLDRLAAIDRTALGEQDRLSYDLLQFECRTALEAAKFPLEVLLLDQLDGPQLSFAQLVGFMRFETAADYERYIARLRAFPRYVEQLIALLERGIALRWVQPKGPLRSIPQQIEGQLAGDVAASPYYAPLKRFPAAVRPADQARLTADARKAIAEAVYPALAKLRDFVQNVYLPAGDRPIGATSLPEGKAFYAFAVRRATTTPLTPQEIHEIGFKEVARIRSAMEAVVRESGFAGTFAAFLDFLRTDARFTYTQPEELVKGYRDICKRADAELPRLFAELPRNTYGVREFPAFEAPNQTTARYYPGAAGSRPGYFMVNTYRLASRPKYEMEALSLHEAVPGHHLQIARAQELAGLPPFRRHALYTAYVEGWALYAESLGETMGFYADPYSKFGQLTYEMWRACRLVVDTGIHALGWSRQQAIDYLKQNTAKSELDIAVEVDRYIVWPGQALAYKIGELKIKELRQRAERELGASFDIRRFHNALLDDGPLPLELLERRIDAWIARQQGSETKAQ